MAQLSAQGPVGAPHGTSAVSTDHDTFIGNRMRDTSGNEYIYCSFGETLSAGQWVSLKQASFATSVTRVAQASFGPIGIVTADVTSLQNGWVQIYGTYATAQITNSEATSAFTLTAPTGATTEAALAASSTDLIANQVMNAWVTAAASTATTGSSSAHSGVTAAVMLNYPFLAGFTFMADTTVGSSA